MDKTARYGTSADAHFGDRLALLGQVRIGIAVSANSANDPNEGDEKVCVKTISDQFNFNMETTSVCGGTEFIEFIRDYARLRNFLSSVLISQSSNLAQHRCLIPINALTGEFVATKLGDDHEINGHPLVCRGHVWQKSTHHPVVSKGYAQLID
jgi:hypothetical protein